MQRLQTELAAVSEKLQGESRGKLAEWGDMRGKIQECEGEIQRLSQDIVDERLEKQRQVSKLQTQLEAERSHNKTKL